MKLNQSAALRFINKFSNIHLPSNKKNIFIFSMPRSGSTWLQELIWTQKGIKYCNEPLNIRDKKIRELSGITSWEELYDEENRNKLIKYFKKHCVGKINWMNPNPLRKNYNFFTDRMVFKIINGGEYLINEISDNCNGKVVYLIRHPIPVALSRKLLPRLETLCSKNVIGRFPADIQRLAMDINNNDDFLEKAILSWCIQNRIALEKRRSDWLIITYEQLVVDPRPIVDKMVSELELEDSEKIFNQLNIPSRVTVQSGKEKSHKIKNKENNESKDFIELWRSKVDSKKEAELFKIIDLFGLGDIYQKGSSYPSQKYLIR
ncbi:sulfotransferase domain-containing protein [Namhaeicola litoreus]|uniref:Sulfotransferase domain-containing protein n=1 Tax=Namhaeicola litoreus TaxID=1052145 RepID=A0ABW3Y4D9_9FLAO